MRYVSALPLVTLAAITFLSCKTDSTTTTGTNGTPTPIENPGSAYFPLTANQVVSARFTGTTTGYDINGSITKVEEMDRNLSAKLLDQTMVQGLPAFGIEAFKDDGTPANRGDKTGYVISQNSQINATDASRSNAPIALVLPPHLSVGLTWNPDPAGSPKFKVTLADHLASFTTKTGNTYSDVIQVEATWHDSTSTLYYDGSKTKVHTTSMAATIYFAKDVGPVEIDGHHIETVDYDVSNGAISNYDRGEWVGSASRNQ